MNVWLHYSQKINQKIVTQIFTQVSKLSQGLLEGAVITNLCSDKCALCTNTRNSRNKNIYSFTFCRRLLPINI